MLRSDTIAALATPVGTSALALVRISGPDTARLAAEIAGALPSPRRARHLDYRDRHGGLLDDVVLVYFRGPHSYTGEDVLEISCHGNPFIAQRLLEDLLARGCRPAEPGEFTQRAFLNGRMDLSQAEAVMDVIRARSDRALAVAQQQLRGALGRQMNLLVTRLLAVIARIEAYIDFPEEDLPPEDRQGLANETQQLAVETGRLMATSHYGELLRAGINTVIVGAPNVGKSSLLNRLVGRERALVSPEPGTTRDFIEECIVVGPHALRIVDTAGLNPAPAALEERGMAKTRERLADADMVLAVVDAAAPADAVLPPEVVFWMHERPSIVVANKSDLVAPGLPSASLPPDAIRVSALTGAGIEALVAAIVRRADALQPSAGPETIAVNARHAHALESALENLAAAEEKIRAEAPTELLASDLRAVLAAYGEVVGKVDNERMLDQLFRSFCIGK